MNKKVVIMTIIVLVLALIPGLVLLGLNSYFGNPPKLEVSNMELTYAHGVDGHPQVMLDFTISNLYHSHVNGVNVTVDKTDYGFSTLLVNPGQIQDASVALDNLTLSSSKTYDEKLTFLFADGQYQTCLGSYTAPNFNGQAEAENASLVVYRVWGIDSAWHNEGFLYLVIKNTGNLPIKAAKCTILFDSVSCYFYVLPEEKLGFEGRYEMDYFSAATTYTMTVQLMYLDGSTQTISTSVTAAWAS